MAKNYRQLQRISTIPVLAALILTSNPSVMVNRTRINLQTDSSIQAQDDRLVENK